MNFNWGKRRINSAHVPALQPLGNGIQIERNKKKKKNDEEEEVETERKYQKLKAPGSPEKRRRRWIRKWIPAAATDLHISEFNFDG